MTIVADRPDAGPAPEQAARKKSARVPWFDGARGYLLTMMFLLHYTLDVDSKLRWVHHGMYQPFMDGEFFVLISGFVCALAYYGAYKRGGVGGSFVAVLSRLKWVYLYQVILSAIMLFVFMWFGQTEVHPGYLADFETPVPQQLLAVLQLRSMPPYLDILMLYIVLMLFIPVALWALEKGARWSYFGVLIGLWLFVKLGLDTPVADAINSVTHFRDFIGLKGYFHPLAYAILFYGPFYLGYRMRKGEKLGYEGWPRLTPPLFYTSLGVLVIGFIGIALMVLGYVPGHIAAPDRAEISALGLVATSAAAYVIWYLISDQPLPPILAWMRSVVRAVFMFPPFQLFGRNSLFVYSGHVLVMFLAAYAVIRLGLSDSELGKAAGFFAGYGLLYALAWAKSRFLPNLP